MKVPCSGKVFDQKEKDYAHQAIDEGWWTEGKWVDKFSVAIQTFLHMLHGILTNSGSSANLLALTSLCQPEIPNHLKMGDGVITVAAGFPTTINPILQNGLVPIFCDVDLDTLNINIDAFRDAQTFSPRAVMLAHTLGNPFNIQAIRSSNPDLFLIEDNCDAFGSLYMNRPTGSFGELSTLSFYPAHHITTAEGGCVCVNDHNIAEVVRSLRDWGRACHCRTGQDNACGHRYDGQFGDLPAGYDHKFVHSHLGYNLKMTDIQAAIGCAQIEKLPIFNKKRRANWAYLKRRMLEEHLNDYFILHDPTPYSDPSWFGFPMTVNSHDFTRFEMIRYLDANEIASRLLFCGNVTKQPYFKSGKYKYRQIGELPNTNRIMNDTFWIGCYPALTQEHLDYVIMIIQKFLRELS